MTTLTRWNPLREFDDLFAQLGTVPARRQASARAAGWVPPVDISETDTDYRLELEIPAVAVADVAVEVKDGVLTVSGERKRATDAQRRDYRQERQFGAFSRSFSLPEDANDEAIEAAAKDGVLQLTIAKREQAQPRRIEVQGA